MNELLRRVLSASLTLAATALLSSCHDEGGVLDAFFTARGDFDCERITVTIDLDDADAVLAPGFEQDEDCSLSGILDNNGCDLSVTPTDDGRLRIVVSGCRIDRLSDLFRCGFSDGDIADIAAETTAVCDCVSPGCDETPPICVSDDPEIETCEQCGNGIDDDNNGDEDCDDAGCENAPECNPVVTTTSSTSTSGEHDSTTYTTAPPTTVTSTSTTLAPAPAYSVKFALENGANVGAVQFDIDYGDAAALRARSILSSPECTKLVPNALASFDDDAEEQVVHVTMTGLPGTPGPLDLAECTFEVSAEPDPEDFTVTVKQALDLDGDPIGTPPDVEVGDITPVTTTTTTVDVTTTTLDGVTTTTFPEVGDAFLITFRLTSATDVVGALQFFAAYSSAPGGFEGHGSEVLCSNLVEDALFAKNDADLVCSLDHDDVCRTNSDCNGKGTCSTQRKELVLGTVSIDGFAAPVDVASCIFLGDLADPPVPGDFPLTVEDATDPDGEPVTVTLGVTVTPP